ncbi:MAG: hypothetical protein K2W95_18475 [Candidatus Obscuribacterales bacterium]|nr:hypothetical protein [Candidatus Obscuribacterales bacterium]
MRTTLILLIAFLQLSLPAVAQNDDSPESDQLNEKGIQAYREKRYDDAIEYLKRALATAKQNSWQELAAAENLALVYEVLKRTDPDAWRTRRKAYFVRNKLQGTTIPEKFNGETQDEVQENALKKRLDDTTSVAELFAIRKELLKFYQDRHRYENAISVFRVMAHSVDPDSRELSAMHQEWSEFALTEGREDDARKHAGMAVDMLERRIAQEKDAVARAGDREALMQLHMAQHNDAAAVATFESLLNDLDKEDLRLPQLHRKVAEFLRSEGKTQEAEKEDAIAAELDKLLPSWQKKAEDRRVARERAAEAKRRKDDRVREIARRREEARRRQEDAEQAEQARMKEAFEKLRLALEAEKAKKELVQAEAQLNAPPELAGKKFVGIGGGFITFIDSDKVDVGTEYQKLSRTSQYGHSNFGEIPDVLCGAYAITGAAPDWTIRIATNLQGSSRVDTYYLRPGKKGKFTLFGGASPLPTVAEGELK